MNEKKTPAIVSTLTNRQMQEKEVKIYYYNVRKINVCVGRDSQSDNPEKYAIVNIIVCKLK